MSNVLKEQFPLIQYLSKIGNTQRLRNLIDNIGGDKKLYAAFAEIARNYKKGNIKLQKKDSQKIKKYNKVLEEFCCAKNKKCYPKRESLLVQSGGAWPILIPIVAEILSSLASNSK